MEEKKRTSLTTQQPDKAVGAVVLDWGIGTVIDVVLPVEAGGKTFAGQQPDKVVVPLIWYGG
jgi:hypothetical protein